MPQIIHIDDIADPRIEPYRDIRERDLVGRAGCFVAEGRVVIEKAVASPFFRLDSLLIAARRLETMADVLAQLDGATPVFVASQDVIDGIAGFPLHRGLLAIGRRVEPPSAERLLASLSESANVIVLSAIANHDNMGGIFRNAAAFGVKAVFLDADCCDPLYRKAIRVSVGAALLVPFARFAHGTDILELLNGQGFQIAALSPRGRVELTELIVTKRNALMLGAEGAGLSPDILARAHSVRLSMAGSFDSLNVATTSGIVLHHLWAAAG
ncbi:MAG: RNA methyltransferase [Candidatus Sphingomonas colombiensis]|nr:RNA methyltransferase [Sphingomonas sp.]WEK43901.1 MAG: RNA methyltransferase [Sphingomonas sp.]